MTAMTAKIYKYGLDGKQKTRCPACGRRKCFSPYVETATGRVVDPERFGYCDHRNSCGYYEYPRDRAGLASCHKTKVNIYLNLSNQPKIKNMSKQFYEKTIGRDVRKTNLFEYFSNMFRPIGISDDEIEHVLALYAVTLATNWPGATLFWLFDFDDRLIDGKLMDFDKFTGKRVKEPYARINWVSTVLNKTLDKGVDPYNTEKKPWFGSQLLKKNRGSVYIVESEKTALSLAILFCHAFGPRFYQRHLPLATLGIGNITAERFARIDKWVTDQSDPKIEKPVNLIPDRGAFQKWCEAGSRLPERVRRRINVSLIMEGSMDGLMFGLDDGEDIHDYIAQNVSLGHNRNVIYNILNNL